MDDLETIDNATAAAPDNSWDDAPEAAGVAGEQPAAPEQAEQTAPAAPEEVPAWKAKQPETIPYDRFAEQTHRLREAERHAQEYAARVRAYEEQQKKAEKILDIEKLDISSYKNEAGETDVEAYMRDWSKATAIKAQQDAAREVAVRLEAEQQQRAQAELLGSYERRLEEAAKTDPEIREKEQYVASVLFDPQNRQFVHPDIVAELAADPHGPEVIDMLARDPAALRSIMDPRNGLRNLHRLSYAAEQRKSSPSQQAQPAAPVVPAFTPAKPAAPRVMASVPGAGSATRRDPSSMSQREYNAWRAAQDRKGESDSW